MAQGFRLSLWKLECRLKQCLEEVLLDEESLWYQKSRERWIEMGDKYTKFFHTTTLIRRQRNKIKGLRNEDGEWTWVEKEMESLAITYFKKSFTYKVHVNSASSTPSNFPQWGQMDSIMLSAPFTNEEVTKAPGPDGFQAIFF